MARVQLRVGVSGRVMLWLDRVKISVWAGHGRGNARVGIGLTGFEYGG